MGVSNVFDLFNLIRAEEHRCSIQPEDREGKTLDSKHPLYAVFRTVKYNSASFSSVIVSGCSFYSMRKQPLTTLELFLLRLLLPLDPVTFTRNKILARLRLHYIGCSR